MVSQFTGGRRMLAIITMSIAIIALATLIFTKQTHLRVTSSSAATQATPNSVRVKFYSTNHRYLGSYRWSNAHATEQGADVTDLIYSDLADDGSDLIAHLPHNYKFDQTNLKNVKALRLVELGSSVSLTLVKVAKAERPTGLERFWNWLTY